MSLVKAVILSRLGQLKVHALLVNATITYGVSYVRNYSFYLFSFSQHLNFYISKVIKKVVYLWNPMVFQVIKTKSIFLRDKLMINKLYTLHPRHKKAFSSF